VGKRIACVRWAGEDAKLLPGIAFPKVEPSPLENAVLLEGVPRKKKKKKKNKTMRPRYELIVRDER